LKGSSLINDLTPENRNNTIAARKIIARVQLLILNIKRPKTPDPMRYAMIQAILFYLSLYIHLSALNTLHSHYSK